MEGNERKRERERERERLVTARKINETEGDL